MIHERHDHGRPPPLRGPLCNPVAGKQQAKALDPFHFHARRLLICSYNRTPVAHSRSKSAHHALVLSQPTSKHHQLTRAIVVVVIELEHSSLALSLSLYLLVIRQVGSSRSLLDSGFCAVRCQALLEWIVCLPAFGSARHLYCTMFPSGKHAVVHIGGLPMILFPTRRWLASNFPFGNSRDKKSSERLVGWTSRSRRLERPSRHLRIVLFLTSNLLKRRLNSPNRSDWLSTRNSQAPVRTD